MPSFDAVSKVDEHELTNAVDQANREISTRFDLKGTDAKVEQSECVITLSAENEFQLKQITDIFHKKLVKRGIDLGSLDPGEIEENLSAAKQNITVRQGIDKESAKKIVKHIKAMKTKVQAQIQDDQVRVTGKKRDDLQQVMAELREMKNGLPLQFVNFRD